MPDQVPLVQPVYNIGVTQKVTIGSSSAATTNAVGSGAILVRATSDCHIVLGDAPTATSADFLLRSGELLAITCSGTNKVAVIQDSAAGNLYVTGLN